MSKDAACTCRAALHRSGSSKSGQTCTCMRFVHGRRRSSSCNRPCRQSSFAAATRCVNTLLPTCRLAAACCGVLDHEHLWQIPFRSAASDLQLRDSVALASRTLAAGYSRQCLRHVHGLAGGALHDTSVEAIYSWHRNLPCLNLRACGMRAAALSQYYYYNSA